MKRYHGLKKMVVKILMSQWDVLMARKCCELVGTSILNKLKNVFQNNTFVLYRDDGLAVIKGLSGLEIERLKKNVVKTFKDCGLNVTIEANLHTVNYLDVTFDLRKNIPALQKAR